MLGEWVTLGQPRTLEWSAGAYDGEGYPIPPRPFTAVSAETGETVPLLTHVSSSAPAPDGSLLVRGGLPETGTASTGSPSERTASRSPPWSPRPAGRPR
ncbi:hypothetical protein ACFQ60_24675 [Streptomyces zhihengii]